MALSAVYDQYLRLVVTEKANDEFETNFRFTSQSQSKSRDVRATTLSTAVATTTCCMVAVGKDKIKGYAEER